MAATAATREEVLLASLCLIGQSKAQYRLSCNRALHCLKGNLDSSDQAVRREHEIDYAAEFVRHEIAYETGAVSGLDLTRHSSTAELSPPLNQRGRGTPALT